MNCLRTHSAVLVEILLSRQLGVRVSLCKRLLLLPPLYSNSYFNINHLKFAAEQHWLCGQQRYSSAGVGNVAMAGDKREGVALGRVLAELENFAPKSLAESWDNVGLLIEPATPKSIKKALLTIDLTGAVMQEALDLSVDLIISYHPPIFAPLKSVTRRTWKERMVALCLENRIAVYSPHTSYDAKVGGVNDWLAAAFETASMVPLIQSFKRSSLSHRVDFTFYKCENVMADSFLQILRRQNIEEGDSLRSIRSGETDAVTYLTLECSTSHLTTVVTTFSELLPPNKRSSMSIAKIEQEPIAGFGMGRLCELKSPITVRHAVQLVKKHIGISHVRLALAKDKDMDSQVHHVALCAGSGGSVLKGARADLWLTGEMQHHDVLEATERGCHVILCNHSDSERGYLKQLSLQLSELFDGNISFIISTKDSDPLKSV